MPARDLIIVNAEVTTLDRLNPAAEAVAIRDGRFLPVGDEAEVRAGDLDRQLLQAFRVGDRSPVVRHLPSRRDRPRTFRTGHAVRRATARGIALPPATTPSQRKEDTP